jgi:hypothetical protein
MIVRAAKTSLYFLALTGVVMVASTGCATKRTPKTAQVRPNTQALASFTASMPQQPVAPVEIPAQFRFITKKTTLGDVTQQVGQWHRVRGSGVRYYEYDLADGSAVLVGPEWPFGLGSRIQNVRAYRSTNDITLAP